MNKPVTVEKALDELEAWRPALAAFYRAQGWFQSAENVGAFNLPLTAGDLREIEAIKAAAEKMTGAA